MNPSKTTLAAGIAGLALALTGASALAEATYGYNAAGTGTVTATAKVNLSVSVPKLILLRVGGTNTSVDTLSWTTSASIPAVPTTPTTTGNSVSVDWDGTAPTFTVGAQPSALNVYAWTNAGTATINCSVAAWTPGTGTPPPLSAFAVAVTGTLPHPGANLGACGSTSFTPNTVASGTWAYTLGGTPAGWTAGTYTTTVTYTATGV